MQGLGKTLRYPVWFAGRVPLERLTMQAVLDNSNEEWLDRLAENLARQGMLNPLVIYNFRPHPPMWIAIGNSRYVAAKRLGWTYAPCLIQGNRPTGLDCISLTTEDEAQSYIVDGRLRFRTDSIEITGVTRPETGKYPRGPRRS